MKKQYLSLVDITLDPRFHQEIEAKKELFHAMP